VVTASPDEPSQLEATATVVTADQDVVDPCDFAEDVDPRSIAAARAAGSQRRASTGVGVAHHLALGMPALPE
jgi:hypothetical protein